MQFIEPGDPLIPGGHRPTDIFHLLFVTLNTIAADTTDHDEYYDDAATELYGSTYRHLPRCNLCTRPVVSTRDFDARTVTNTVYTNDDGPIHLLGRRRQDCRRLRGLLRRGLGERDERHGREREPPLALGCTMDWQRQRRHGTRGGRGLESTRREPRGLRSPRLHHRRRRPLYSGSTAANTERRTRYVLTAPFEVGFPLLVSNFKQGGLLDNDTSARRSQRFTTGGNRHGYELKQVNMDYNDDERDPFSVALYSVDQNGHPDSLIATLNPPDDFHPSLNNHVFTPPENSILAAKTIYALVVQPDTSGTNVRLLGTPYDDEDRTSLDDWSIEDAFDVESEGTWAANSDSNALNFEVRAP